ncbi:hypothetical protein, partial [Streptococcus pneumoniae]
EKRNHPGSKLRQGFWMVFRFGVNNWGIYIKRPQFENYGLIFCPNVNHLELLFNLFFLVNVPVLIPVTVFNPL